MTGEKEALFKVSLSRKKYKGYARMWPPTVSKADILSRYHNCKCLINNYLLIRHFFSGV
jgi:hypothetical protein